MTGNPNSQPSLRHLEALREAAARLAASVQPPRRWRTISIHLRRLRAAHSFPARMPGSTVASPLRMTAPGITGEAALTLENERLQAELGARIAELRACRARMRDASEAVRRRIERDLHDGMQQRLVSVAMSLGLLEAKLPAQPHAAGRILRDAREAVAATLEELRELSQGLYPSSLIEGGLTRALEELRDRSPFPARLENVLDTRPPVAVEACAYFVVSEALTNAAKHSHANEVRIAASTADQLLVVEVADDGIGGAAPHGGSGLRGLAERVEARRGRLIVSSPPGHGTTVRAEIPCA